MGRKEYKAVMEEWHSRKKEREQEINKVIDCLHTTVLNQSLENSVSTKIWPAYNHWSFGVKEIILEVGRQCCNVNSKDQITVFSIPMAIGLFVTVPRESSLYQPVYSTIKGFGNITFSAYDESCDFFHSKPYDGKGCDLQTARNIAFQWAKVFPLKIKLEESPIDSTKTTLEVKVSCPRDFAGVQYRVLTMQEETGRFHNAVFTATLNHYSKYQSLIYLLAELFTNCNAIVKVKHQLLI